MYVTATQAARRLTEQTGFEVSVNVINGLRIKAKRLHEMNHRQPLLFFKGRHRGEYFRRFHCNWFELIEYMKKDKNYSYYLKPRVKKEFKRPSDWAPEPPIPPTQEIDAFHDVFYNYRQFLKEHYGC